MGYYKNNNCILILNAEELLTVTSMIYIGYKKNERKQVWFISKYKTR